MEVTPTLRDLFEEALNLPPAERARLLADRCSDPELRAELERMLNADATEDELLGAGDAMSAALAIGDSEPPEPLPQGARIGPFQLLEILGEGGSSTVFRAFRETQGVRQYVAVKLLARGLYTPEAQRRFRHEREALARLKHPGIARLIEGGVAENGLAYIALELIDGVPITRYASEKKLSEQQRLNLFLQVCRAVESAHRALIVHRDLKPSNVLVTPEGEVKLLDFGIAKLLDDTEDATRTRHQALTPAYAAPEQFDTSAITTATDVFALGVLLHELLTGERMGKHTQVFSRRSSENAMTQPSPQRLQLHGDLANIVAKATTPEPERRYGTAGALAEDIERYLDRRPVSAHSPSRWYRTGKFIARHRGAVAVASVLLLVILAALAVASWQAHVARRETQRAEAIRDFVVELLRKTAPDVAANKRPDVPTLVYTAAQTLPKELRTQPDLRAELLYTLGDVLRDMRDIPHSEVLLREAEASAASLPIDSPVRIGATVGLVRTLIRKGDYSGAQQRIDILLEVPAQRLPANVSHAELLKIAMVIADARGDMQLAVLRGRQMLAGYRAACGAHRDCDGLDSAQHDFATVLLDADRIAEARPLADASLSYRRRYGAPIELANSLVLDAKIALYRGDLDRADVDAQQADALLASLGNGLQRKPTEPRTLRIYAWLTEENGVQALNASSALLTEQRAQGSDTCDSAETAIQQTRALLLLARPAEALSASQSAVTAANACREGILHDLALALAELERARALWGAGAAAAAQAEYLHVAEMSERVHAIDPLSWPIFLIDSMRLAQALGRHDDAMRDARALIAALARAQALTTHPWRLEAQLLLMGAHDEGMSPEATLDAQIAQIEHWPIGKRLARQHASLR